MKTIRELAILTKHLPPDPKVGDFFATIGLDRHGSNTTYEVIEVYPHFTTMSKIVVYYVHELSRSWKARMYLEDFRYMLFNKHIYYVPRPNDQKPSDQDRASVT